MNPSNGPMYPVVVPTGFRFSIFTPPHQAIMGLGPSSVQHECRLAGGILLLVLATNHLWFLCGLVLVTAIQTC